MIRHTPHPADGRLDRLLLKYWDNTLSADEAIELDDRLKSDPAAREWFRWFCTQAACAAEWAATRPDPDLGPAGGLPLTPTRRTVTRRRALAGVGAGLAAGLAGFLVLWRESPSQEDDDVFKLVSVHGQVLSRGLGAVELAVGAVIKPGMYLETLGTNSRAVLARADGSTVTVSAGSTVSMADDSTRLIVRHGSVSATVPSLSQQDPVLSLATPLAVVNTSSGMAITLTSEDTSTEVQVQLGRVTVSNASGVKLADVNGGERLTVRGGGRHTKERFARTPDDYTLDLTGPLPDGWGVGTREVLSVGPAVAPEWWYDPYHSAVLSQIRSNNQWTRGMVRVHPDSTLTVRYRADRERRGQVCLCVRTERTASATTGVLEWNGTYEACGPGEWKTIEVSAADLLNCKEAPTFPPPWVGFLLIFNTYDADIGLRVADFRVSRPGGLLDG